MGLSMPICIIISCVDPETAQIIIQELSFVPWTGTNVYDLRVISYILKRLFLKAHTYNKLLISSTFRIRLLIANMFIFQYKVYIL